MALDRREMLRQLRELIELDRGFGVEFVPRQAAAASSPTPAAPARPAATPVPPSAAAPARVSAPASQRPAASPAAAQPAALAPASDVPAPPAVHPAATSAPAPLPAPASVAVVVGPAAPDPPPDQDSLARIASDIAACTACGLCATRTRTVPGEGHAHPELLFIGEGPGAEEDAQGRPFVGAAGQLLTRMIEAMGLSRAEVFIANVVKCRPPGNRNPEPQEVAACMGYLHRQVAQLRPKVICTLGNVPLRALFGPDQPGITKSRGQLLRWRDITVIPTFHPSYLLRTEQAKKPAWQDLQLVLRELGRPLPERRRD